MDDPTGKMNSRQLQVNTLSKQCGLEICGLPKAAALSTDCTLESNS